MSFVTSKKDDTTSDRVFQDLSQFRSAFEFSVEVIDRNMRNSEFLAYRSPRLLRKDMEENSLHENERGEFLRDKSRPFAHTTDTIIVSRFDKMKADKPHAGRIVRNQRLARHVRNSMCWWCCISYHFFYNRNICFSYSFFDSYISFFWTYLEIIYELKSII